jgi:hypothetical protein
MLYVILGVKTSMGAKWPRGCLLLLVRDQHILKEVWHWILGEEHLGTILGSCTGLCAKQLG